MSRLAALAAIATLIVAGTARADGVDLAVFQPTPATTGTGFQLQAPDVGPDGSWVVSSVLGYASNPLVLDVTNPSNEMITRDEVVRHSGLLQLGAAYAFLDRFEVGAHMPFFSQTGQPATGDRTMFMAKPAKGTAIGNLTLHAKVQLLRAAGRAGTFGLGASLIGIVPTATDGQFTGADKPEGRGLALLAYTPSALGGRLTVTANGGAVVRGRTEYANIVQKSAVAWGGGAAVHVLDPLWLSVEVFGESTLAGTRSMSSGSAVLSPVEWLAGLTLRAERRFTIGLAGGRGVTDALGTPDVRGMLSLAFVPGSAAVAPVHAPEPIRPDGDADGDGIPDSVDKCPNEPEDFDMFEDQDGCPDPDNDHDGIPDAVDKCPLDPE
ncbi:MAG TPA: thrombospondin type 3 repeat-containing protein, partial [Kofleriaceae bacterium]